MKFQITLVEPFLFVYMYCVFIMHPTEQQLIYRKVCLTHFNQTYCDAIYKSPNKTFKANQNIIQGEAAQWDMYIGLCKTIPAVFSTIILGGWSDRVGRKKILMMPVFGDTMNAISYWLNAYFFEAPVPYLFIGNIISAMFGNFATILMGVFSYIADITTEHSRTKRVTILESMIYLGSVVSHVTGGVMLEKCGFVPVYSLIVVLHASLMIYLYFLKESYDEEDGKEKRQVESMKTRVIDTVTVVFKKRKKNYRMSLLLLLGCFFILVLLFTGINSITVFYVLHQPLNFRPSQIGYFFTEVNAIKFIGATLVNLILIRKFKWSDYSIILLAALMYGGFTVCIALSKVAWNIYLVPLWCLGLGTGTASTRAGMSKMVSPEEQGKVFSVAGCLEVLILLVSSTLFNSIYKHTLHITPSFTFYFMASLSVIPIVLAILLKIYGQKRAFSDFEVEMDNHAVHHEAVNPACSPENPDE